MEGKRFIHLRLRTEYSLLSSVLRLKDVFAVCSSEDKPISMCIMDDVSLSGALEFSLKLSKLGVKPLFGLNLFVQSDGILDDERFPYIGLIAKGFEGYKNLIKIIHRINFQYQPNQLGQKYIKLQDIADLSDDIICLSGGYNGIFGHHFFKNQIVNIERDFNFLQATFGDRFYIELTRHGRKNESDLESHMVKMALDANVPLVATNDVYFSQSEQFFAHDILSCIRDGRYIHEKGRYRLNDQYYLKSEKEMIDLFSDIPEAIDNTVQIAKRCSFLLEESKPMLPSFGTDGGDENDELFRQSEEGLVKRLSRLDVSDSDREKYFERLKYESSVISKMGFAGYFLIVSDFIKWAKENGIPVGPGRGSGAGSIVAWALLITNIDPIRYGLLFERFLNPDRVSMPDFDIDFCQDRRDEIIDYVRNKYGHARVANIITFGKLQAKAAIKDVGRVLHFPYSRVDEICKLIPFSPLEPITIEKAIQMDSRLQEQRLDDPDVQQLLDTAIELEGLNRHTSTHAAGIVIADRDITEIAPVHKDNNSDGSVIAFNMKDAEKIGLVKFDFLGLKTLTLVADTCKMVYKNTSELVDIDNIPLDDETTFNLLRSGKLKGVFQLEAALPREALRQINTDRIEDLIAITSLNRPGPMDNIPSFIRRKNGQEEITYYHPLMESVLKETFGIIIYQEQVMQIAQVLAGYTLGEADLLRRAMGKKIQKEMDQQRQIFVDGCKRNQIDEKLASQIFDLVDKFAGYGFNKSHAAAYSVISYQTAYLKAHFTIEFITNMLNLDIHNTDKLNEYINDAKIHNIKIVAPDINRSEELFSVSSDRTSIIYGLGALKAVGIESSREISKIRKKEGGFRDIFHFCKSCGKLANKKNLESMMKAGCFDSIYPNRVQLLDSLEMILKYASDNEKSKQESNQVSLFGEEVATVQVPKLPVCNQMGIDNETKMSFEFESFGFYLTSNPLDVYSEKLYQLGIVDSSEVSDLLSSGENKKFNMSGVITKIVQRFGKRGRFAFLHLLDLSGIYETMIFSDDLISSKRDLLNEGTAIVINVSGKKEESGNRLIVNDIFRISDFIGGDISAGNVSREHVNESNSLSEAGSEDKPNQDEDVLVIRLFTSDHVELFMSKIKDAEDANGSGIVVKIGKKVIRSNKKYDHLKIKSFLNSLYYEQNEWI